jgi:hypothetical protein
MFEARGSALKVGTFEPKVAKFGSKVAKFESNVASFGLEVAKFGLNVARFGPKPAEFGLRIAKFALNLVKFGLEVAMFDSNIPEFGLGVEKFDSNLARFASKVAALAPKGDEIERRITDDVLWPATRRARGRHMRDKDTSRRRPVQSNGWLYRLRLTLTVSSERASYYIYKHPNRSGSAALQAYSTAGTSTEGADSTRSLDELMYTLSRWLPAA